MRSLISVMMPAYNAAATLPMAIASLQAQTYEHWELVLVDDGSKDGTGELIQRYDDERIRYIALDRNYGRGYARQVALENCIGDYLTVLDADDWIYPYKIERQLAALEEYQDPDILLASSGMIVVNADDAPIGSFCPITCSDVVVVGPHRRLDIPDMLWITSLIRMPAAKSGEFDGRMLRGQDKDFLLQIMYGKRFVALPEVTYVRRENLMGNRKKILSSHRFRRKRYRKHFTKDPLGATGGLLTSLIKTVLYRLLFLTGQTSLIKRQRYNGVSSEEEAEYRLLYNTVRGYVQ